MKDERPSGAGRRERVGKTEKAKVGKAEKGEEKKDEKENLLSLIAAVLLLHKKKELERKSLNNKQLAEKKKSEQDDVVESWEDIIRERGRITEEANGLYSIYNYVTTENLTGELGEGVRIKKKRKPHVLEGEKLIEEIAKHVKREKEEVKTSDVKELLDIARAVRGGTEEEARDKRKEIEERWEEKIQVLRDWGEVGEEEEVTVEDGIVDWDGEEDKYNFDQFLKDQNETLVHASEAEEAVQIIEELMNQWGVAGGKQEFLKRGVGGSRPFVDQIGRKEFKEIEGFDLGRKFERFKKLMKDDVDYDSRFWFRHVREIDELGMFLASDRDYLDLLDGLEDEEKVLVDDFVRQARGFAGVHLQEYVSDKSRQFNWLTGEWTDAELTAFFSGVFEGLGNLPNGRSREDTLGAILNNLRNRPTGMISVDSIQHADGALRLIESIRSDKLEKFILDYAAVSSVLGESGAYTSMQELMDDRPEFVAVYIEGLIGHIREQLRELTREGSGKIPKNFWEIMAERKKQAEEGRGRGRSGDAAPVRMEAMMPQEPGAEGPPGAFSPFAHDNLSKALDMAREKGGSKQAIEWMFNFLIRKDLSDRDQYYLMQNVKDMISGAEGKLHEDPDMDMLTRATYQEFLGQLEIFRALPGVQSEEQLMGVLGRISVGDMEDLMVWGKDFEDKDGVVQFSFVKDGGGVDYLHRRQKPQLDGLEIRGADVAALLETQYWFNKFQYKTRGSPANELRRQIFMEAMFRKMGGIVETEGSGREATRRYFVLDRHGNRERLQNDDLRTITLKFKDPKAEGVTLGKLAEENLWLTVIGEMNWELTGKRPEMNKLIDGRRTIYRWDKHFHYDVYMAKWMGGGGESDFLYGGYGKGMERKPYLSMIQPDFVSARVRSGVLMPYLTEVEGLIKADKLGTKEVKLVSGVQDVLAGGDEEHANKLIAAINGKFFNSRGNLRDMEIIHNLFHDGSGGTMPGGKEFLRQKLPDYLPEDAKRMLQFSDAERDVLTSRQTRWDKLFLYLFEHTGGTKLSGKELAYFIREMGGEVRWNPDNPKEVERIEWGTRRPNQEIGARLFLGTLSRQRMYWEQDEQDRFQKEANYTRQSGAQAAKLAMYLKNPTSDSMIEYLSPFFGFRSNAKVRELAFQNTDALMDARSRWSVRQSRVKTKEGTMQAELDYIDADGYPVYKTRGITKEALKPKNLFTAKTWNNALSSVRTFVSGKAGSRGYEPLDAWGKKTFIDKMWRTGMVDWWQKEKLMVKHVSPPIPIPVIGPWFKSLVARGFESDSKVWKTTAFFGSYLLGSVSRPLYLYLWIHDWGMATENFWNEIIAPAIAGEEAKALQIPTG